MKNTKLNESTLNLQIPEKYGETMITLMVVGPRKLYVYWEIMEKEVSALKDLLGNNMLDARYTLRIYDISDIIFNGSNARYYFDIDVDKDAGKWYIDLWTTDNSYCVELGIKTNNRNFSPLGRSNCVSTPKSGQSIFFEPMLMKVEIESGKTVLPLERYAKYDVMTADQSICNSNNNPEITGYEHRDITEPKFIIKYINKTLNNPGHNTAISRSYETLKNKERLNFSSIALYGLNIAK